MITCSKCGAVITGEPFESMSGSLENYCKNCTNTTAHFFKRRGQIFTPKKKRNARI